jgi:hypothetical protein
MIDKKTRKTELSEFLESSKQNIMQNRDRLRILFVEDDRFEALPDELKIRGWIPSDGDEGIDDRLIYCWSDSPGCFIISTRSQLDAQILVEQLPFDMIIIDLKLDDFPSPGSAEEGSDNGGFYVWVSAMESTLNSESEKIIYTGQPVWTDKLDPLFGLTYGNPFITKNLTSDKEADKESCAVERFFQLLEIKRREICLSLSKRGELLSLLDDTFNKFKLEGKMSDLRRYYWDENNQTFKRGPTSWKMEDLFFPELSSSMDQNQKRCRIKELLGPCFPWFLRGLKTIFLESFRIEMNGNFIREKITHALLSSWQNIIEESKSTLKNHIKCKVELVKDRNLIDRLDKQGLHDFNSTMIKQIVSTPQEDKGFERVAKFVKTDLEDGKSILAFKPHDFEIDCVDGATNNNSSEISQYFPFWKQNVEDMMGCIRSNCKLDSVIIKDWKHKREGFYWVFEIHYQTDDKPMNSDGKGSSQLEEIEKDVKDENRNYNLVNALRNLRSNNLLKHKLSHLRYLVCNVYEGELDIHTGNFKITATSTQVKLDKLDTSYKGVEYILRFCVQARSVEEIVR